MSNTLKSKNDSRQSEYYSIRQQKINVTISLIGFSIGIFSLRVGSIIFAPIIIFQVGLLLYRRSDAILGSVAAQLLILYPGLSLTKLYGLDTQSPAVIANRIGQSGWPVGEIILSWGFPETPVLHIHALIVSLYTNLGLVPTAGATRPLVGPLLGLTYGFISLLFVYLAGRECSPKYRHYVTVTVLFWVPFLSFKTLFSRQSIAMALFLAFIWLIYSKIGVNERRGFIISTLVTTAIVAAHHLTSFILVLFIISLSISSLSHNRYHTGKQTVKLTHLLVFSVLFLSIFSSYYVITGVLGPVFIGLVSNVITQLSSILEGGFSVNGTESLSPSISRYVANPETWITIRNFVSKFIYTGIVATVLITGFLLQLRDRNIDNKMLWAVIAGTALLPFVAIGLIHGAIDPIRIMTFFVMAFLPLAFCTLKFSDRWETRFYTLFTTMLLLTSLTMVPPHIITGDPNFDNAERTEEMEPQLYSTAYFVKDHIESDYVLGDSKTRAVVAPISQTQVQAGFKSLLAGNLDKGETAILSENNKYIYYGFYVGEGLVRSVTINPPEKSTSELKGENIIYNNGMYRVYEGNSRDKIRS